MIDSSRYMCGGELLFYPRPDGGEHSRRVVIDVIDPSHNQAVIDSNKPFAKKPTRAGSGNDELQVRYDESLGGESNWPTIWRRA